MDFFFYLRNAIYVVYFHTRHDPPQDCTISCQLACKRTSMLGAELPLRFDALKAISLQISTPDWKKFRTIPKIPTPSAVTPVNIDI